MRIPLSQRTQQLTGSGSIAPLNVSAVAAPIRALRPVGENISEIGSVLLKRQQKMQEERDYLDAINARMRLDDYARSKEIEVSQLLGKDALDIYPSYEKDIDNKIQNISSELPQGAQLRFQALSKATRRSTLDFVSRHVATEMKVYKTDLRNAWLLSRTKEIAMHPDQFEDNLKLGYSVIDSTVSGPESVIEKQKFYDVSRAEQLASMIAKDPYSAEAYIEQNREVIGAHIANEFSQKAKAHQKSLETEARIKENEVQKKIDKMQKTAHDNDEREIGDLYLAGNYTGAFRRVIDSQYLTGDEKRVWANAIKTESKPGKEKVNPNDEVRELVNINSMIAHNVEPRFIRNYIITSSLMSGANKEQYINKLETKLDSQIEEGKKQGYRIISDIIVPKLMGGAIATLEKATITPSQSMAILRAQNALDSWLKTQISKEKYPDQVEIRNKAAEFGQAYQIPISERMEEIAIGIEKRAKEMSGESEYIGPDPWSPNE